MPVRYDAIVIGAGQSGPSLADRLVKDGQAVAVIERRHFGGTCINTGCVPTKTLVASAYVAHMVRRASDYGVDAGPISIDMKQVKARKDAIVEKSRGGVASWMERRTKVYRGHARLTGPRSVMVNEERLEADRIIINTGGRAFVPPLPGLDSVPYLTNTSLLDLETVPEHLIIIGGSYIGLEFAQIFRRFGAQVSVIEMAERLIAREDQDVSEAVREILAAEGINIHLKATCLAVERDGAGIAVRADCSTGIERVRGSHLLIAVGRRPNTDDLGLEAAGVKTDDKGYIIVDDQCRTNVEGIWAMGDVNGRGAFTHTSWNDYEVVAANMLDNDPRRVSDRISCYGLFIDPPLGRVGMTERQVRETGVKALSGKLAMTSVGRARERGETLGFMKVIVEESTKRILGAAILGVGGDEVAQTFLPIMAAGQPFTAISRIMLIHPTVTEFLPTLLDDLRPLG